MKTIKTCNCPACKNASRGRREVFFKAANRRQRRKGKNAFLMAQWRNDKPIVVEIESTGYIG